jgi:hypothetical protein
VDRQKLLREMKARLSAAYGDRLRGIVLYGSEVRGDADADSDIDVLVLLEGGARTWHDVKLAAEALYDLTLALGRTIDAMPVDARLYEEADAPLYVTARREGIRA